MRTAFISTLTELARTNRRIHLVVGDMGYNVVEPFAKEFPDRFLNAGVAEQNMVGIAAGLAAEGNHVFIYSTANFPTLRCLEQIRNDVCLHKLPVAIVAVGAGFAYGNLGPSHHALQDIGVMRTMPNITVLSPCCPNEAEACVRWLCNNPRPSYLRLGRGGESNLMLLSDLGYKHQFMDNDVSPVAVVSTGAILSEVADILTEVRPAIYSYCMLKPVTLGFFRDLQQYQHIVVVEEHVGAGGLASLVTQFVPCDKVTSLHVPEHVLNEVGSQSYLRKRAGIDCASIQQKVEELWVK